MTNPQTFGKFQLVGKLATGGMAEVFLAQVDGPAGFQKTLVLKRILPHLAEDESFVQMFLNEARLAARLDHPNIVTIFDLGEEDGSYFIAMEYIDGPNLRTLGRCAAKTEKSIPVEHAAKIISLACEGLGFAHDFTDEDGELLNLIHRDISPDNILLSRAGAVKVVDFGIAKAANQSAHLTKTGTIKGKLSYMPPEQVRGKPLDRRADVFSLGVVLYELIAGMKPFDATSEVAAMQAVLFEAPTPLLQKRPDCPPTLWSIVERTLQKDREDRYPDCRAMQLDLERFLMERGTPIGAYDLSKMVADIAPPDASTPRTTPSGSRPAPSGARLAKPGSRPRPAPAAVPVGEQVTVDAPRRAPERKPARPDEPPDEPPADELADQETRIKLKADEAPPAGLARDVANDPRPDPKRSRGNGPVFAAVAVGLALVAGAGYALFGPQSPTGTAPLDPAAGLKPLVKPVVDGPPVVVEPAKPAADAPPAVAEPAKPDVDEPPAVAEPAKPDVDEPPAVAEPAKPDVDEPPAVAEPAKPDVTVKPTATRPAKSGGSEKPTRPSPARPAPEPVPAVGRLDEKVPSPTPAAAVGATLIIQTDPPCSISVDGKRRGTSPVRLTGLSAGSHAVVITNAQENLKRQTSVTLASGETKTESIKFGKGKLIFRVRPWAQVQIDGKLRGTTPLPDGITVYEGEHRVRLFNPDLQKEVVRTVWVKPGADEVIKANLEQ